MNKIEQLRTRINDAEVLKVDDSIRRGWSFEPEIYDEDEPQCFEIYAMYDGGDDLVFYPADVEGCTFNADGSVSINCFGEPYLIQPLIIKPVE